MVESIFALGATGSIVGVERIVTSQQTSRVVVTMMGTAVLEVGFLEQDEVLKNAARWRLLVGGKKIYR